MDNSHECELSDIDEVCERRHQSSERREWESQLIAAFRGPISGRRRGSVELKAAIQARVLHMSLEAIGLRDSLNRRAELLGSGGGDEAVFDERLQIDGDKPTMASYLVSQEQHGSHFTLVLVALLLGHQQVEVIV